MPWFRVEDNDDALRKPCEVCGGDQWWLIGISPDGILWRCMNCDHEVEIKDGVMVG